MAFRLLFVLYPFNKVEQKILPWVWLSYGVYLLCGKASFLSPITKLSPSHTKPGREGKMLVLYLRHRFIRYNNCSERQVFSLYL